MKRWLVVALSWLGVPLSVERGGVITVQVQG